ncbi:hypothetical protein Bca4012_075360 [Brassica carinata]
MTETKDKTKARRRLGESIPGGGEKYCPSRREIGRRLPAPLFMSQRRGAAQRLLVASSYIKKAKNNLTRQKM